MEEYFSTRFLTYSSDNPSSSERTAITSSASEIWLCITETVQTVLLSATLFGLAGRLFYLMVFQSEYYSQKAREYNLLSFF